MAGSVTVQQPYLTVGDVARATGVAPSAVRFYESHDLLTSERTAGNQRRFRESDVCRTKIILVARRVGLSVAEIKELLAELPADPAQADWERLAISLMMEAHRRIEHLRSGLDEIASGEKLCDLPPADRTS